MITSTAQVRKVKLLTLLGSPIRQTYFKRVRPKKSSISDRRRRPGSRVQVPGNRVESTGYWMQEIRGSTAIARNNKACKVM